MHLKGFSAYGFKSFADKIEMDFGTGITAIVGPNGSGKSNISDAVRWVLGEQSAKYLRGSKMEDIIFSGSGKRRPLGVAEVTLNFENNDHRLGIEFDEVSVTRRVYRDGDSEYAINKKNCRLKDIVDLFADTGLGKGSLSIIGQNKIDEILNSRPEERRTLFEEAAGIVKFRLRKKDAMRRLDDTENNLTRINDIKCEVGAQVEPLRLAAEKTKKYNVLADELRNCKLAQFVHKIDNIEEIRSRLNKQDEALEQEVLQAGAEVRKQQVVCTQIQHELDLLSEQYTRLQDDIKNKETALEKLRGKEAVLEERKNNSRKAITKLEQQYTKLEEQIGQLDEQLQKVVRDYDGLEKRQKAADFLLKNLQKQKTEKETAIKAAQEEMESMQNAAFDTMREMVDLRNKIRSAEQEQEQRMRKREALKRDIDAAEELLSEQQNRYRFLLDEQAKAENNRSLTQRDCDELVLKLREEEKELKNATNQHNAVQGKMSALESRLTILENMQKSYEGFGYGIKTVMNSNAPWRANVIGVAAELFSIEPEYVAAMETALGAAAQNIVVKDAATAKSAINYLKERQSGRATFLPLDTLKVPYRSEEDLKLAKMQGIRGFAVDLIKYSADLDIVFKFLLGRILIAENMDAALAAAKKSGFKLRVVTLQGDVVNAGGSLTGGSRQQKEHGFLSRQKEIAALEEKAAELRGELLVCRENLEEKEEAAKASSAKLNEKRNELQKIDVRLAEVKSGIEHAASEQKQSSQRLEILLDERNSVSQDYMATRQILGKMREELAEIEKQETEAKGLLDELQRRTASDNTELESLRLKLEDARVEFESASVQTTLLSERMQQLDKDMGVLQQELRGNEKEREENERSIAASESEKEAITRETELLMKDLQGIVGGKDEFAEQRRDLMQKSAVAGEQLSVLQKELGDKESKRNRAAMEIVRQNSDYDHAVEQLAVEYRLSLEEARTASDLLGESDTALRRRELKTERDIEALGVVNMAAIEQYAAVSERFEFLEKQYNDLSQAKENLENIIGEINSGMSKRFKEAFGKINEYFSECYVKLFGGGTAVLKLSNPDDLLNSGIDIEVQPPGKKLQSLFLLSGGERALTVIALLFALLSYRPAPFCILDEIDAALDEANVDRFAKFLAAYAENTQFIVITHRKGTMEAAHVLHGVTMEESGVSKLLSVKLTEKE